MSFKNDFYQEPWKFSLICLKFVVNLDFNSLEVISSLYKTLNKSIIIIKWRKPQKVIWMIMIQWKVFACWATSWLPSLAGAVCVSRSFELALVWVIYRPIMIVALAYYYQVVNVSYMSLYYHIGYICRIVSPTPPPPPPQKKKKTKKKKKRRRPENNDCSDKPCWSKPSLLSTSK